MIVRLWYDGRRYVRARNGGLLRECRKPHPLLHAFAHQLQLKAGRYGQVRTPVEEGIGARSRRNACRHTRDQIMHITIELVAGVVSGFGRLPRNRGKARLRVV